MKTIMVVGLVASVLAALLGAFTDHEPNGTLWAFNSALLWLGLILLDKES